MSDSIDPGSDLFDALDLTHPHPQPDESQLCRRCGAGHYDGRQQHVPGCPDETDEP